jgi:hypothetical protein
MAKMLPSNKSLGQVTIPLKPAIDANTFGGDPLGRTPEINLVGTWCEDFLHTSTTKICTHKKPG